MTRESRKKRNKNELKYFLATLALPVALVGFPVALLLGAIFGQSIYQQGQSMMPFVIKCGLGTIGIGAIMVGIAMLLRASLG